MTVAKNKPMALEEYLSYNDGTGSHRYELWNGILVDTGAESDINIVIGTFLIVVFSQLVPYKHIRRGTEVEVKGDLANTRVPDLLVVTEAGAKTLTGKTRSLITLDMPAPVLAIEMVSSSDTNKLSKERDYVSKRREYAAIGISEYWIIDSVAEVVVVLNLSGSTYVERKFVGTDKVVSSVLSGLDLTAQQILSAEM